MGADNTKIGPQGLKNLQEALVMPWAAGASPALQDIFRREIYTDDVKLPSQSAAYGINKAFDLVRAGQGTDVRIPHGTGAQALSIDATLDASECHNMRLLGGGAGPSGYYATSLYWTGAVGGTMLKVDHLTGQTVGVTIEGFELNGQATADRLLDTRGMTQSQFNHLRFAGAKEWCWWMDIGSSGENSQGNRGHHLFMDPYVGYPSGGGFKVGPGGLNNDTAQCHFYNWQIQHLNGTGMDLGACDTITFEDLRVYRFPGGTAKGLIVRAGTVPGSFVNWCQDNHFDRMEIKPLDGSAVNYVEVQTGVRDPQNNHFHMLDQSGTEYPTFAGSTVLLNTVSSELGYLLQRGAIRIGREGIVTLGGNYEELGVPLTLSQLGIYQMRYLRSDAPVDARRWDIAQDTNGGLVERTRDDTGLNGAIARSISRTGTTVTANSLYASGEKLRVTASGTQLFGLGNYANDAAAAAGTPSVPVGGLYHTSGALKIRLV